MYDQTWDFIWVLKIILYFNLGGRQTKLDQPFYNEGEFYNKKAGQFVQKTPLSQYYYMETCLVSCAHTGQGMHMMVLSKTDFSQ